MMWKVFQFVFLTIRLIVLEDHVGIRTTFTQKPTTDRRYFTKACKHRIVKCTKSFLLTVLDATEMVKFSKSWPHNYCPYLGINSAAIFYKAAQRCKHTILMYDSTNEPTQRGTHLVG